MKNNIVLDGLTPSEWLQKAKDSAKEHGVDIDWKLEDPSNYMPIPFHNDARGKTYWTKPIYPWEKK